MPNFIAEQEGWDADAMTHFIREQSVMTLCGAPLDRSHITADERLVDCQGCRYYLHMRKQREHS